MGANDTAFAFYINWSEPDKKEKAMGTFSNMKSRGLTVLVVCICLVGMYT